MNFKKRCIKSIKWFLIWLLLVGYMRATQCEKVYTLGECVLFSVPAFIAFYRVVYLSIDKLMEDIFKFLTFGIVIDAIAGAGMSFGLFIRLPITIVLCFLGVLYTAHNIDIVCSLK
ncbi:MAG TPA: hypothetical protein PK031_07305 [Pseudomonadales bacterium]|nr:hypothetical protein [Pseudomonadales bacterium]